jgi:2-polyprenyl-3-methyl-5-hydroxy-6-metoxy-1,4-benzoquinol methylase
VGVDRSAAMLLEARIKARGRAAHLDVVCADMRDFRLRRAFPLVTCFYDVLNHLREPSEVADAIRTAAAHVSAGGLYVFDTNNERMFERVWDGPSEIIDVGTGRVEIEYLYDRARRGGSARVTFRRAAEEPITGWVHERCHPAPEIERALSSAGLEIRHHGPHPYFADAASSLKDLWICRKR